MSPWDSKYEKIVQRDKAMYRVETRLEVAMTLVGWQCPNMRNVRSQCGRTEVAMSPIKHLKNTS